MSEAKLWFLNQSKSCEMISICDVCLASLGVYKGLESPMRAPRDSKANKGELEGVDKMKYISKML